MLTKRIFLYNNFEKIVGILNLPNSEAKFPCVITCHGYYSTKDGVKYVEIANKFCSEGFAVLRFDFRGCGESDGNIQDNMFSGRVSDLGSVIQYVRRCVNLSGKIGILGSSIGSCVAIVKAAEDSGIMAVVAWSTPPYISDIFENESLKRDVEGYDMLEIIKKVKAPILMIHGSDDELTPINHITDLFEMANEPKDLRIIKGGDHKLSSHEYRGLAINLSLDWFKRYI